MYKKREQEEILQIPKSHEHDLLIYHFQFSENFSFSFAYLEHEAQRWSSFHHEVRIEFLQLCPNSFVSKIRIVYCRYVHMTKLTLEVVLS